MVPLFAVRLLYTCDVEISERASMEVNLRHIHCDVISGALESGAAADRDNHRIDGNRCSFQDSGRADTLDHLE